MALTRQLKTKLQAVGSISQMTRAMQLVSAAKMRKSQDVAFAARPYAKKALGLLRNLTGHVNEDALMRSSSFFKQTGIAKECIVVLTSDRGLCGAYNAQVLRKALELQKLHPLADIVAVGRKAHDFFKKRGHNIAVSFSKFSDVATLQDAKPLADWIIAKYQNHTYDRIFFCCTTFISALKQQVVSREILPLDIPSLETVIKGIVLKSERYFEYENGDNKHGIPYVFEPSRALIFEKVVEELVKVEIVHLVFEANASEHSSRMLAMKNATDNAQDLEAELRVALNKARQQGITQELAEITGAKEALSSE